MNALWESWTQWRTVLPLLTGGLGAALAVLLPGRHPPRAILENVAQFGGMLKVKARSGSWYESCSSWLIRNGTAYHYWKKIEPGSLCLLTALLGASGAFVGGMLRQDLALPLALLLGALPLLMIPVLNRSDNERMLPELKLIYHALAMQIRSGVYVTDALAECYASVEEPRLRDALLDLAGDIVMKSDLIRALDRLQRRFDNRYIDALCVTICQAMESGQAVELLGDLGEQVKDMERTVLEKRKNKLDRSVTFYQLGILSAVLGVAIYSCVMYMLGAAVTL